MRRRRVRVYALGEVRYGSKPEKLNASKCFPLFDRLAFGL
jgi:hypothetical protein